MSENLRNEYKDSAQQNKQNVDNNTDGREIFAASVESFCSADVKGEDENRRFKFELSSVIRLVLMLVCFSVFCYSVFAIASRISDDNEQEDLYDSVRPKSAPSAVERPNKLNEPNIMPTLLQKLQIKGDVGDYINPEPQETEMTPEDYRNAIAEVYRVNKDVYGWIVVTGTDISYPIMLGEDNDYYLYHNYKHQETKSGSIFADMSLSPNHPDNYNALIYGHDMRKGMFRGIKVWYESPNMKSLADNMEIQIYTMDAMYVYKFFSAYRSSDFNFTKTYFKDKEEYQEFLDSIYKRSVLNKKFSYNADETRICTLITCTNVPTNPDERYVLHGILTKVVPYNS